MQPWHVLVHKPTQRRVGKLSEELAELLGVAARISLQGVDGVDPESGKTNLQRLQDEIADVIAQVECCIDFFKLPHEAVGKRVREKKVQMDIWEDLVLTRGPSDPPPRGSILRYGEGETDILRLEAIDNGVFVGTHIRGWPASASASDCRVGSWEDHELWELLNPEKRFVSPHDL